MSTIDNLFFFTSTATPAFAEGNTVASDLFEALDSGDEERSLAIIDTLRNNALDGDQGSIDVLTTVAARSDTIGDAAEAVLFDIGSGRSPARPGTAEAIATSCLKLYELDENAKNAGKSALTGDESNKLSAPSKLLYMAGREAVRLKASELIKKIAAFFYPPQNPVSLSEMLRQEVFPVKQDGSSPTPWDMGREITGIELDISLGAMSKESGSEATPVDAMDHSALATSGASLKEKVENSDGGPVFVPVCTAGGHWVSLVLYEEGPDAQTGEIAMKAALFDSIGGYYNDARRSDGSERPGLHRQLTPLLRELGVTQNNFARIEASLQENAPNGCGVFTVEAFKRVSDATRRGDDPASVLEKLATDFVSNADEQARLNSEGRVQIHGALIEHLRLNNTCV